MAKIKTGGLIAQASGSIAGTTFSHGRFGPYIRNRSIPVQPETQKQLATRDAFASASTQWKNLAASTQKGWKVWAQNNPIVDSLGDKRVMDGHQAFTMLATRLLKWGWNMPTTPPIIPAPVALQSLSIAASAATQNVTVTFAASPLTANCHLWITGCKPASAAINYVKNLLRFMDTSNAGQATDYVQTNFGTIAGTLVAGDRLVMRCHVADHTTGLISVALEARCTCAA